MTKQPSLHANVAGAGRLLGPQSATLELSERLLFKHPNSCKAEKCTGALMPAPAELFTSPKLNLTFLLDLIALVRKGQMGEGWISG